MSNWKLHIVLFHKLLHLISTFLLLLSLEFQNGLSYFLKSLSYLYEAITTPQLVLKSPITCHTLDLLYYTTLEIAAVNKAISTTLLDFVDKVVETKNKHLQSYAMNLINKFEPLQPLYLMEYNPMSIALIIKSLSQSRIIS